MLREFGFIRTWQRWGFSVAWHNMRWRVGYAIGGFTHASNFVEGEDPDDETTWLCHGER